MQYSDSIARFLQNEELHISKKEVAQIKTLESKGKGKNKKKVPGKGKNKKKVTGKGKKVPHSHVLIGEKVMMRLIKEEVEDIDLGKYYRAMDKLEKEEVRKKAKKAAQKAKRGALMWDIGMKELKNT